MTFFLCKLQKRLAEAVFFRELPRGGKVPLARAAVLDAAEHEVFGEWAKSMNSITSTV